MKFPIYKAVGFIDTLSGGSTYPMLMEVVDANGDEQPHTYVVKVFKPKNIEQYQPTNKEFYVAALAKWFDIKTSEAAFIYLDDEQINYLKNIRTLTCKKDIIMDVSTLKT